MKNPIVEEVRRHRMEHTSKHNGDLSVILVDLREVQKASGHTVVRLPGKRIEPTRHSNRSHRPGG